MSISRLKFLFMTVICHLLLVSSPAVIATQKVEPYFAEPFTGKRVKNYEVELPLTRHEKGTFKIPQECGKLTNALLSGAGHWGSRIERRLWLKVDDDCRYYAFLNQSKKPAQHDAVSSYDFLNAKISDLPLNPECDPTLFLVNPLACPPALPGTPDFSRLASIPGGFHTQEKEEQNECRFRNGIFRGYIINDGFTLRCIENKRTPGFRIISVDFTDINEDGYQDAVLRMVSIGPGTSPVPTLLPLTRTTETQPFHVPPGIEFPRLGPGVQQDQQN